MNHLKVYIRYNFTIIKVMKPNLFYMIILIQVNEEK